MNLQQISLVTLRLLIAVCVFSPLSIHAAAKLEYVTEEIFRETSGEMMWQVERSRRFKTVEDVEDYLQQLNTGSDYSDWRLPTKRELYELHSIFDLKGNGEVKTRVEGSYWLTDESSPPVVGSWEIGDQCGPSRTYYTGKAGYVRAVRP